MSAERTPVLVGIGEITDRPADPGDGLEPLALLAEAVRRAAADAGGNLLAKLDSLVVINQVSWGYTADLVELLGARLAVTPARREYGPVGGESPVRYLHEAATRIAAGQSRVAVVCGAESQHTVAKAGARAKDLPWTSGIPQPPRKGAVDYTHPLAVKLGASRPVNAYPLYENATAAAWGETPRQALRESAALWARYSAVAATNPFAWLKQPRSAEEIMTPGPGNRLLAYPYSKLMVANPMVNQGAAVLVTSLAEARAAGIPDDRLVFVWGGAAASEPLDIAQRASFTHSDAQEAVLLAAQRLAADERAALDAIELYSCFPCVPKMTRRILGLGEHVVPTVTGGLTFFGAPLNDYMTHATCGMVRHLRAHRGHTGLLYGQGGFVTKHHALVVGTRPPSSLPRIADDGAARAAATAKRRPPPRLEESTFAGAATLETFTVLHDREGNAEHGIAFLRLPDGARALARVPGTAPDAMALLTSPDRSPIGTSGLLARGADGLAAWHPTRD